MHVRYPHVGIAAEAPLEAALMLGLDVVVEFVGDPLADLGEHGARVEPWCEAPEDRADDGEAAQISLGGLGRPGVLHFDRDVIAVAGASAMHLAEGGKRERLLVEVGEQIPDAGVEVVLEHAFHATEGDGPGALGQRSESQRLAGVVELEHRQELRQLRPCALEPAELRSQLPDERECACGFGFAVRLRGHRCATAFPSARHRPARARWIR